MTDEQYKALVARLREQASNLSEIYPDYAEAADAIEWMMREKASVYGMLCAKLAAAEARAERAEAALREIYAIQNEGGGHVFRQSRCMDIARAVLAQLEKETER